MFQNGTFASTSNWLRSANPPLQRKLGPFRNRPKPLPPAVLFRKMRRLFAHSVHSMASKRKRRGWVRCAPASSFRNFHPCKVASLRNLPFHGLSCAVSSPFLSLIGFEPQTPRHILYPCRLAAESYSLPLPWPWRPGSNPANQRNLLPSFGTEILPNAGTRRYLWATVT